MRGAVAPEYRPNVAVLFATQTRPGVVVEQIKKSPEILRLVLSVSRKLCSCLLGRKACG
jgi:hypothetical protein